MAFDTGSPAGGGMADTAFEGFGDPEGGDGPSALNRFTRNPTTQTMASFVPGGAQIVGVLSALDSLFGGRRPTGGRTPGGLAPNTGPGAAGPGGGRDAVPGTNVGGGGNRLTNFLLGRPGEFSQVPTDPSGSFFSEGQRTLANRFLDPSKDPTLQRQIRGIGNRLGITSQGAKGALASEALASHSARAFDVFNRGFTGTRPITRFTEPGEGLLGGPGGTLGALNELQTGGRENPEGRFFGRRTPDVIRDLNPFERS